MSFQDLDLDTDVVDKETEYRSKVLKSNFSITIGPGVSVRMLKENEAFKKKFLKRFDRVAHDIEHEVFNNPNFRIEAKKGREIDKKARVTNWKWHSEIGKRNHLIHLQGLVSYSGQVKLDTRKITEWLYSQFKDITSGRPYFYAKHYYDTAKIVRSYIKKQKNSDPKTNTIKKISVDIENKVQDESKFAEENKDNNELKDKLKRMKIRDLRSLLSKKGAVGYSKLKKADLVDMALHFDVEKDMV